MPKLFSELLKEFRDQIKETILVRPAMTYREIAARFGVSVVTVKRIARRAGARRPHGPRAKPQVEPNSSNGTVGEEPYE